MVKIIFCLRRKAGLSSEAFQEYWRTHHATLVLERAKYLGIRRYVQSHTIFDPRLDGLAEVRGFTGQPFDGVAELWVDSVEVLYPSQTVPLASLSAAHDLLSDESQFIDLEASPIFVTEEREVIAIHD